MLTQPLTQVDVNDTRISLHLNATSKPSSSPTRPSTRSAFGVSMKTINLVLLLLLLIYFSPV